MNFEDFLAAVAVGDRDRDFAVEPAGPAQCRIEDVGKVGCGDDDQVLPPGEAIHEGQELRDDPLLDFAHGVLAARSDCVDLIYENDAWRLPRSFLENLPEMGFALPVELVNDLGAVHREKTSLGFVPYGASDQRLSAPWRAMQKHPLWCVDSKSLKDLRITQRQLDDFADPMKLALQSADVLVR